MNKKNITIIVIVIISILAFILTYYITTLRSDLTNKAETNSVNKYRNYTTIKTSLDNNTIAYIPLDDRPINIDRVKYLSESIGYNVQLPSEDDYKTYLDNVGVNKYKTQYGNPQELSKWLEKMESSGCDYYIISIDQLFSGGLVGSRYLNDSDFEKNGTDFSYVKKVFEKIVNDSNNKVYLFDTVMRLASTIDFQGLNNNDYNSLYAFGSIGRKTLLNEELTIDNIIKNYTIDENGNKINNEFTYNNKQYSEDINKLNKYLKARERKLKLYDYYINLIKDKKNISLTISIDDSSKTSNSIQKNEINYLNKITSNVNRNIYIRDGIDEQGMLMLSKLAIDASNIKLNVKTTFYGDKENKLIGLSANTYKNNYSQLLKTLNISETNKNEDFDVLIYTTPDDINKTEEISNQLLDKYIDNIINHIPTVIIDSQGENGEYLRKTLYEKIPMGYLIGYSKWNYFSNSSGVALSEGIVRYLYLRSNQKNDSCDKGFLKLMAFSYVKDIGYLPNLREKYSGQQTDTVKLTNDMKPYENAIINNMKNSNYIADLINYTERGIEEINITNYYFPWKRGFEINFSIDATIGSTKSIEINYLNKKETVNNTPSNNNEDNKNEPEINNESNNNNTQNNNENNNQNNTPNNNQNNPVITKPKRYITHYSYISPSSNGNFDYYNTITRAEFAKWLCLANNIPLNNNYIKYYKDVTTQTTNWQYIVTATNNGYFIGDNNSNFNPNSHLTRAEAVTAILRVVERNKITYSKTCNPKMPDVSTNAWYYNAMKQAASYCIIEGDNHGNFNPTDNIKKVEMVTIINRTLKREHNNMECDLPEKNPFSNVSENYWGYQQLVEAAVTHTCSY